MQNLPKHKKYEKVYKPNDIYWGLGVEHETYIESSKLKQITLQELKEKRARERYCVDYYSVYNKESLDKALDGLFEADKPILIPILLNSHTFQKTDIHGEHQTTYERIPKPNPKFNGKTIFDWMKYENPEVFCEEYENSYLFDGDTIEFVTQQFYKTTVFEVIHELYTIEKQFIKGLNSLPRDGIFKTYAPFKIAQENYPFASYLTNLKNNAMFNNGTIHINITLPTRLNEKAEIDNIEEFTKKHQNYAKVIQWLSPLIVAKYGAHDPLCESTTNGDKYSAGSQRVAVSRYIGLGTYDTDVMEVGKILTRERAKLKDIDWYDSFHTKVDYKYLDELGMDINFNKHYSHGIEFRILESLDRDNLRDIMDTMVYLADFSLEYIIINPRITKLWHKIAEECVHNGKGYLMDVSDQNELYSIFHINYMSKEPLLSTEVYDIIVKELSEKYRDGKCVRAMIMGLGYEDPMDVIYKMEEETPMENSIETPEENSIETPEETPVETPEENSVETPAETPHNVIEVTLKKKLCCIF
jgi:hypothetical protein